MNSVIFISDKGESGLPPLYAWRKCVYKSVDLKDSDIPGTVVIEGFHYWLKVCDADILESPVIGPLGIFPVFFCSFVLRSSSLQRLHVAEVIAQSHYEQARFDVTTPPLVVMVSHIAGIQVSR